jgi:hypothetical protein
MQERESQFPERLEGASGETFERVAGRHALASDDAHPVLRDGEPPIGAFPVYRKVDDDALVVATGRIFARVAEGQKVNALADDLRSMGYAIEKLVAWAPEAAWLHAPAGVAASLGGLARLRALAGILHAEPELMRRRAPKS